MVKRTLIAFVLAAVVGLGVFLESTTGTLRFWLNQADINLFRSQFPDAIPFAVNVTAKGLTTFSGEPGESSLVVDLHLSYLPNRNHLVVELVEQPAQGVFGVRNRLVFPEPQLQEVLAAPIDEGIFDRFPSIYPGASPVPRSALRSKTTARPHPGP